MPTIAELKEQIKAISPSTAVSGKNKDVLIALLEKVSKETSEKKAAIAEAGRVRREKESSGVFERERIEREKERIEQANEARRVKALEQLRGVEKEYKTRGLKKYAEADDTAEIAEAQARVDKAEAELEAAKKELQRVSARKYVAQQELYRMRPTDHKLVSKEQYANNVKLLADVIKRGGEINKKLSKEDQKQQSHLRHDILRDGEAPMSGEGAHDLQAFMKGLVGIYNDAAVSMGDGRGPRTEFPRKLKWIDWFKPTHQSDGRDWINKYVMFNTLGYYFNIYNSPRGIDTEKGWKDDYGYFFGFAK
jgi:hypothetical protein